MPSSAQQSVPGIRRKGKKKTDRSASTQNQADAGSQSSSLAQAKKLRKMMTRKQLKDAEASQTLLPRRKRVHIWWSELYTHDWQMFR